MIDSAHKIWDAIVVGAGPAGCAAAYDLASAGQSVLVVDNKTFPRQKACAGGLTAKAVNCLRYSIDPIVRTKAARVRLEGQSAATAPITLKSREPICVMTVRAELDSYCLAKTMAAGAFFTTISSIKQIDRNGDSIRLATSDAVLQCRYLVGADGSNGPMRLLCSPGPWFSRGFALEVQAEVLEGYRDLTFDFAAIPGGYGWLFPKQDHWNVGLYVQSSAGRLTRSDLLRYAKEKLGIETLNSVIGQHLGLGAGRWTPGDVREDLRGRVFLAGDAGGFVDALTGEGIYGALLSGQAAAKSILSACQGHGDAATTFAASLRDYRQTLSFSSRAAGAFYANPSRGFRIMRLPWLRRTLVKTYSHGLNVHSLPMRAALALA